MEDLPRAVNFRGISRDEILRAETVTNGVTSTGDGKSGAGFSGDRW